MSASRRFDFSTFYVLFKAAALFAAITGCTNGRAATTDGEGIHPYELANGLTVVLRPLPKLDRAAVLVLFDMGNGHDPIGKSGRAHLLEHLYGTAATDTSAARGISELAQRYGGQFNLQTGFDYTVIAGVVETESVANELKDAAERMTSLRITEADLEREVPRMRSELRNMYGGIPALAGVNHVRNLVHAIPGGGRYAGATEHLDGMGVEELREAWKSYYKPDNAILAIAGGFEVAEVRNDIVRYFGAIPAGEPPPSGPTGEAKTGTVTRVRVSPVVSDATGLVAVGHAAPEPGSQLYGPFLIVVSRLWAGLRGQLQPGKPAPVVYTPLDDPTMVVMQAGLSAGEPVETVFGRLDKRLQGALSPTVTRRDRRQTLDSMAMLGTVDMPTEAWRRNIYGLAFSTARRLQLGIDGSELANGIEAATEADMQRLASTVFAPERRIAVVIEPAEWRRQTSRRLDVWPHPHRPRASALAPPLQAHGGDQEQRRASEACQRCLDRRAAAHGMRARVGC